MLSDLILLPGKLLKEVSSAISAVHIHLEECDQRFASLSARKSHIPLSERAFEKYALWLLPELQKLEATLNNALLPITERVQSCLDFLTMHFHETKGSCIFFTAAHTHRIVQAIMFIGYAIQPYYPEKSVCEILLPGISLEPLSEKVPGTFKSLSRIPFKMLIKQCILSDCSQFLLPISLLTQTACEGPIFQEKILNPYVDPFNPLHKNRHLTENEIRRLYRHNQEADGFLQARLAFSQSNREATSLLDHVTLLSMVLEINSRGNLGSETDFGRNGYFAFGNFIEFYRQLTPESQDKIPPVIQAGLSELFLITSSKELNTFAPDRSRACSNHLQSPFLEGLQSEDVRNILATIRLDEGVVSELTGSTSVLQKRLDDLSSQRASFHRMPLGRDILGISPIFCKKIGLELSFHTDQDIQEIFTLSCGQIQKLFGGVEEEAVELRKKILNYLNSIDNLAWLLINLSAEQGFTFLSCFTEQEWSSFIPMEKIFYILALLSCEKTTTTLDGLGSLAINWTQKKPLAFLHNQTLSESQNLAMIDWVCKKGSANACMALLEQTSSKSSHLATLKRYQRLDSWRNTQDFSIVARMLKESGFLDDYQEFCSQTIHTPKFLASSLDLLLFSKNIAALPIHLQDEYIHALPNHSQKLRLLSPADLYNSRSPELVNLSAKHRKAFKEIFFPGQSELGARTWRDFLHYMQNTAAEERALIIHNHLFSNAFQDWMQNADLPQMLHLFTYILHSPDWPQTPFELSDIALLNTALYTGMQKVRRYVEQLNLEILFDWMGVMKPSFTHWSWDRLAISLENEWITILIEESVFLRLITTPNDLANLLEFMHPENRQRVIVHLDMHGFLVQMGRESEQAFKRIGHILLEYKKPIGSITKEYRQCYALASALFAQSQKDTDFLVLAFLSATGYMPDINLMERHQSALLFSLSKAPPHHAPPLLDAMMNAAYQYHVIALCEEDDIERTNDDGDTILILATRDDNVPLVSHILNKYSPNLSHKNSAQLMAQNYIRSREMHQVFADYIEMKASKKRGFLEALYSYLPIWSPFRTKPRPF